MNWVDLVVLAVLALSGLLAFMRGLVREVLGLGAWVAAAVVASSYGLYPTVQPYMAKQFADPTTANIVAFGSVFIVTLIILWIIAGTLGALVRDSVLGGLDRTLGLVFGIARGAVLVALLYVLVGMAVPAEQWPQPVLQARALLPVYHEAEWLASQLPEGYRPTVTPPPSEKPTSSADLLQPKPEGRALGPRTSRD
jgi:membrane protein required for colicin V production